MTLLLLHADMEASNTYEHAQVPQSQNLSPCQGLDTTIVGPTVQQEHRDKEQDKEPSASKKPALLLGNENS